MGGFEVGVCGGRVVWIFRGVGDGGGVDLGDKLGGAVVSPFAELGEGVNEFVRRDRAMDCLSRFFGRRKKTNGDVVVADVLPKLLDVAEVVRLAYWVFGGDLVVRVIDMPRRLSSGGFVEAGWEGWEDGPMSLRCAVEAGWLCAVDFKFLLMVG